MKNINLSVQSNILTITIDLSQDHGPSKSGKTTVIASTLGNVSLPAPYEKIKLGVNVYK